MGSRHWSKDEVQYLEEKWGVLSVGTIAKKLGRTPLAVSIKIDRLKLGRFSEQGEYVTLNQAIVALYGVSSGWHKEQVIKLGIPCLSKKINKSKMSLVELKAFWEWAELNKSKLNFSQFKEGSLGVEPDWVKTKRFEDGMVYDKRKEWTEAEEKNLVFMVQQFRFTRQEIAKKFNRTEGAIERRLQALGVKERPLKNTNKWWTKEEEVMLYNLLNQGFLIPTIAEKLERSQKSVKGKIYRDRKSPH